MEFAFEPKAAGLAHERLGEKSSPQGEYLSLLAKAIALVLLFIGELGCGELSFAAPEFS